VAGGWPGGEHGAQGPGGRCPPPPAHFPSPFSGEPHPGKITIGAKGRAFTEGAKATDGRGIDHFFTAHGEAIVTSYFIARGG